MAQQNRYFLLLLFLLVLIALGSILFLYIPTNTTILEITTTTTTTTTTSTLQPTTTPTTTKTILSPPTNFRFFLYMRFYYGINSAKIEAATTMSMAKALSIQLQQPIKVFMKKDMMSIFDWNNEHIAPQISNLYSTKENPIFVEFIQEEPTTTFQSCILHTIPYLNDKSQMYYSGKLLHELFIPHIQPMISNIDKSKCHIFRFSGPSWDCNHLCALNMFDCYVRNGKCHELSYILTHFSQQVITLFTQSLTSLVTTEKKSLLPNRIAYASNISPYHTLTTLDSKLTFPMIGYTCTHLNTHSCNTAECLEKPLQSMTHSISILLTNTNQSIFFATQSNELKEVLMKRILSKTSLLTVQQLQQRIFTLNDLNVFSIRGHFTDEREEQFHQRAAVSYLLCKSADEFLPISGGSSFAMSQFYDCKYPLCTNRVGMDSEMGFRPAQ